MELSLSSPNPEFFDHDDDAIQAKLTAELAIREVRYN